MGWGQRRKSEEDSERNEVMGAASWVGRARSDSRLLLVGVCCAAMSSGWQAARLWPPATVCSCAALVLCIAGPVSGGPIVSHCVSAATGYVSLSLCREMGETQREREHLFR